MKNFFGRVERRRKAGSAEEDNFADDLDYYIEQDEEVFEEEVPDDWEGYPDNQEYDNEEILYDTDDERYEAEYFEEDGEYEAAYAEGDGEYTFSFDSDEISYEDTEAYNANYRGEDESEIKVRAERVSLLNRWKKIPVVDRAILVLGVAVLVLAFSIGGVWISSHRNNKHVSEFINVGASLDSIQMIGEKGMAAIADARLAMIAEADLPVEEPEEEAPEYEENAYERSITVVLNMTSIQKDLKIKFLNQKSDKLIANVPFSLIVKSPDGKKSVWSDDDMDGIIYKKDIAAGTYELEMEELTDIKYADYAIAGGKQSVVVKKDISYQKVDVSNEVKSESEIDAKREDTAKNETEVESVLTDTVAWVESSVISASYSEVSKDTIPDPLTIASLRKSFFRMSLNGSAAIQAVNGTEIRIGEQTALSVTPAVTAGENETISSIGQWTEIVWTSLQPDIATVDQNGVVTGIAAGEAKIQYNAKADVAYTRTVPGEATATEGEAGSEGVETPTTTENGTESVCISGEIVIVVREQPGVRGELIVSSQSLTMVPGGTATAQAAAKGYTEGRTLIYTAVSDKPEIAAVSIDGTTGVITVTALTAGQARITVACDYTENGGEQTVTNAVIDVMVGSNKVMTLEKQEATAFVSNQTVLHAFVEGVITPAPTVTVESSDPNILKVTPGAIVNENNRLTIPITLEGISVGSATLTVRCAENNEEVEGRCTVMVKPDPKQDRTTQLKDNQGNLLYVLENNTYRQATYADYYSFEHFYISGGEKYTGWQMLDGKVYFFLSDGTKVTGEQVIQGARYTFAEDGTLVTGNGILGIDVSKWNGNIDWTAVKNSGVSYAIIRCGYRGSSRGALIEDPKYVTNIRGAIAAGLQVGVYFFTQATDEREAIEEASMVLDQIRDYSISYPVFLDVEPSGGRGDGITNEMRTAVCKAFCQTIQNAGYTAGIYANKTWLETKLDVSALGSCKIWLAQYAAAPTYTGRYDLWQYRKNGTVSGISGNVDLNMSYLGH